MQFQVPQFIDVEDKIFGPLTLRQFLYLAGAGAGSFILFFSLDTKLWIAITVILGSLAAALAFVKYNGRSMLVLLGSLFRYLWLPKFYLWRYNASPAAEGALTVPKLPPAVSSGSSPLTSLLLKFKTGGSTTENRK